MNQSYILCYDGSFNGFLSVVFMAYQKRIDVSEIRKNEDVQNGLFSEFRFVRTEEDKARRVWVALEQKNISALKNIYFAFLSEQKGMELLLFHYINRLFFTTGREGVPDHELLRIEHMSRLVGEEKQQVETWTAMKENREGILIAAIEPYFNVIPLVSKHFKSIFREKEWLLYDHKRSFGIFYTKGVLELVSQECRTNSYFFDDTLNGSGKIETGHKLVLKEPTISEFPSKVRISKKDVRNHNVPLQRHAV